MIIENEDHLLRTVSKLREQLRSDKFGFDTIREYVRGERGLAKLPENSTEEIKELRKRSGHNVMPSVVNTFSDALKVTGYADADSEDSAPVWGQWNELDLTSVQPAVHRSVVTYGVGFVSILPGRSGRLEPRAGSPRNTICWYDAVGDRFPSVALEVWTDSEEVTRGVLIDELSAYPLEFESHFSGRPRVIGEGVRHGATFEGRAVVPVVRFLNTLTADDDDQIVGDVEPLTDIQRAINEVNFTRLLCARYGAHPMRIITGWEAPSQEAYEAVANSVDKVLALADENIGVHTFDPADPAAYTAVISSLLSQVNVMAGLNPTTTGASTMSTNLSAEALALVDSTYRARVAAKQTALGPSWKLLLRLIGFMSEGIEDDPSSEIMWQSLETPTIGAVGDLISKGVPQGVPVEYLIELIPGLTAQQKRNARKKAAQNAEAIDAMRAFNQLVDAEEAR